MPDSSSGEYVIIRKCQEIGTRGNPETPEVLINRNVKISQTIVDILRILAKSQKLINRLDIIIDEIYLDNDNKALNNYINKLIEEVNIEEDQATKEEDGEKGELEEKSDFDSDLNSHVVTILNTN